MHTVTDTNKHKHIYMYKMNACLTPAPECLRVFIVYGLSSVPAQFTDIVAVSVTAVSVTAVGVTAVGVTAVSVTAVGVTAVGVTADRCG